MRKKYLVWFFIIWSSILISSFVWNYSMVINNNMKIVLNKSRAFFEQIITARYWNSDHGGVYVPTTPETPSNPYIIDPLRDIITDEGLQLTKINPAYMTRQIAELNLKYYDIQFHITSLNPIRHQNKADEWEIRALKSFNGSKRELLELVRSDSGSQYRYMAPLVTEFSCLKCHVSQGYKVGDIRGGISVSFPSTMYLKGVNDQVTAIATIHLLILVLGLLGFVMFYRVLNRYYVIINKKSEELLQINTTKDKFFSIIAHDLRGPIITMMQISELISENKMNKETHYKFLHSQKELTKNTFQLLDNLLNWARFNTKQIEPDKKEININKIIDKNINSIEIQATLKNITILKNYSDLFYAYSDEEMFNLIVRNILSNAVKFTSVNGTINIDISNADQLVKISVTDTGPGILEENIEKILSDDQFFTTYGTDNEKGNGLGLKLCRNFISANNGKLNINSEINKGTTISFTLPVHEKL